MVELLQDISLDIQPQSRIIDPPEIWRKGKFITRQRLHAVLDTYAASEGILPDISYGVNSFMQKRFIHSYFNRAHVVGFMVALSCLTGGVNFFKSRSLNYLSDSDEVSRVLDQTLENTRFMIDLFGMDFFSRDLRYRDRRRVFFKALIPDSDFYLTIKGGSGAGTFSADFAIGIEKGQGFTKTSGEIWRTGFDTEILEDGTRGVRIIRTGTGVKHDPFKTAQFEEFKHALKTSPARALTFLVTNYVQRLQPTRIVALTTHGAKILSSLPKGLHSFNYTRLFREMGFVRETDTYWLELADFPAPRKREQAGFDRLTETLRNLRDINGNLLPLS